MWTPSSLHKRRIGPIEAAERHDRLSVMRRFRGCPGTAAAIRSMLAALVDLVLPETCVSCDVPGMLLCRTCRKGLGGSARLAWPTPAPTGLPPPYAVADYAGVARAAVLAHKEGGCFALAGPLGAALAVSIRAASSASGNDHRAPVLVVPVPSSRAAVRSRGHDPLLRVALAAARTLRRDGHGVRVAPMLTLRRRVADQAGLDAVRRAANLAGAMSVRARPWIPRPRTGGSHDGRFVRQCIVVDDVITTGATLAEAARVLRAAGVEVPAAAVIAATARIGSARLAAHDADLLDYTCGPGATSVPSWHPPGSVVALPERA